MLVLIGSTTSILISGLKRVPAPMSRSLGTFQQIRAIVFGGFMLKNHPDIH